MPTKSKYVLCLERLGFKPLAEVIGTEAAKERERLLRKAEEDFTRGLNRAERRRWIKIGKTPRFARLGEMTFATDDTDSHWAIENKVDLAPHGFVDMVAFFAGKAPALFAPSTRLH